MALVNLAVADAVAEIELNNPPLNLVTHDFLQSLHGVLAEVARAEGVRVAIVHGGPARAFCAGSDIKEFAEFREDASERKILFEDLVLRMLARLPIPTIAAIDGPALGGGLEIALACDLRVAQAEVALGLTESRLGGLAGSGAVRLTRLIGPGRAKELLFTGETIMGAQALEWGLVSRSVSLGTALNAARELASTIRARGPLSMRLSKTIVDAADDTSIDAVLSQSTVALQEIFNSADLHTGVAAFFAKSEPEFIGR
jgi:enoyl-CoA hydratase